MNKSLVFAVGLFSLLPMLILSCPIQITVETSKSMRMDLREKFYENLEMVKTELMEGCVVFVLEKATVLLYDIKMKHNDKNQLPALRERFKEQRYELERQQGFLFSLPQELSKLPIGCTALKYILSNPLLAFPTNQDELSELINDLIDVTWYSDGLIKDAKMYPKECIEPMLTLAKERLAEVECMLVALDRAKELLK